MLRLAAWALKAMLVACGVLAFTPAVATSYAGKTKGHSEGPVELVLGVGERLHAFDLSAAGARHKELQSDATSTTALGSLWKLFVYVYILDTEQPTAAFRCTGQHPKDEVYCCSPGNSIERDAALVRSCGLFFEPERLGLNAQAWRRYWQGADVPAWVRDLAQMQPATTVSIASLMQALAAVPVPGRQAAMHTLLGVGLESRGSALLNAVGSTVRLKTWSWHDAQQQRIGGAAGWLADGTPIWLRASGTSATVLERAAPWLGAHLPRLHPMAVDEWLPETACVSVHFFRRYPLQQVLLNGKTAAIGPLRGQVKVRFANGQELVFAANGQLQLIGKQGEQHIEGRLGLNEYVARVIEREGSTRYTQAAQALGVAARTYVVRHADFVQGCYRIDDDSRTQRVASATPSAAALAAARWSDGLVLTKASGRYHATQSGAQQMAWSQAQNSAEQGAHWNEILQDAYTDARLTLLGADNDADCQPMPRAQQWLAQNAPRWQFRLQQMVGFELVSPPPSICTLFTGKPYADINRQRIYATGAQSATERLTLTHEYLHFALRHHPSGRDEAFVERSARALLGIGNQ